MSEELKNNETIEQTEDRAEMPTANEPPVRYIQLGDTKLRFDYTVNALCEVERVLGMPIDRAIQSGTVTTVRALFWGGLISWQPNLSLADAGELMQSEFDKTAGEARITMVDFAKLCYERLRGSGLIE